MTAAHRAAWFAAGVAATVASLAALAVHWGRAAARTEAYGMHMTKPELAEMQRELDRRRDVLAEAERRREQFVRLEQMSRSRWPGPAFQIDEPLRVESYRPEGET